MKSIEVLLREPVDKLGDCGDVVKVAAGYARNYLLPRRLAVAANEENKKMMARRRARLDLERAARAAEVQRKVDALSGIRVETIAKTDEHGHLYGSVNAARVAELVSSKGYALAEKDVRLDEGPIKAVGVHPVRVHVQDEKYAILHVVVTPEDPLPVAVEPEEGAETPAAGPPEG